MKIVSTSYVNTPEFTNPEKWLGRISFYTGLLEELARQHEVESIEQINYAGVLKQNGVTYHFLNFKERKLYFPFRLHRYIKNLGPQVVFVNGFVFPLQIIQLRKVLGKKVKIIILHRAEKPFGGVNGFLQSIADRSVDAYLFASDEFGDEWIKKGIIKNRDKIHEVVQASSSFKIQDKSAASKTLNINANPVFLWVGRLDQNKDPLTVIHAFIRFTSFQPSAKLYMIFQAEKLLDDVKRLINADDKISKSITLVGRMEHPQLQTWYNAADFFISGSHYEGSGISAIEAMSCGCIPILTDIISFRRMTGPGKCGLLYQAGNVEHLLSTLKSTNELNIEIEKQRTLKQFADELSFQAIAGKINKITDSLHIQ